MPGCMSMFSGPRRRRTCEGIWRGASTVVVGRGNYEGFYSVWPGITTDPSTDPRTRDLGVFLNTVEKVVVSRTLQEAGWENSRIARDLESEVKACGTSPAGTSS